MQFGYYLVLKQFHRIEIIAFIKEIIAVGNNSCALIVCVQTCISNALSLKQKPDGACNRLRDFWSVRA